MQMLPEASFKLLLTVFMQMESARKAWENSPSLVEKSSPVTSSASPITSGGGAGSASFNSFSSASVPQIPVASVTPSTSLSGKSLCMTSTLHEWVA